MATIITERLVIQYIQIMNLRLRQNLFQFLLHLIVRRFETLFECVGRSVVGGSLLKESIIYIIIVFVEVLGPIIIVSV